MKKTLALRVLSAIFVSVFLFTPLPHTLAKSSVNPSIIPLTLTPGEVVHKSFIYYNENDEDMMVSITTRAFRPSNSDGTGSPVFEDNGAPITSLLTDWVRVPTDILTVAAGERKEIGFDIIAPEATSFPAEEILYTALVVQEGGDTPRSFAVELGVLLVATLSAPASAPVMTALVRTRLLYALGILIALIIVGILMKRSSGHDIEIFPHRQAKRRRK